MAETYPIEMPKLSDEQIIAAMAKLSGYFTRPEDVVVGADELAAHGIKHIFATGTKVRVVLDGGSYSFNTGNEALAHLISKLVELAHVLGLGMHLMRAADEREEFTPRETERLLEKIAWRYGQGPSGELPAAQEAPA